MKPTKKDITAATIALASINVLTNIWWLLHKDIDHRPLVLVNIIVALLLGGIVIYMKRQA